MRFIFCILLFVIAAMAVNDKPYYNLDDAPALFEKFIIDYNRNYKDEADKAVHYEAFLKSLHIINKANADQSSMTFDINKFSDYTPEESKHLFGYKSDKVEGKSINEDAERLKLSYGGKESECVLGG